MFSDHLRKVGTGKNGIAGKVVLALGGLAIVGQLGAVAMVADGQVRKAEQRASRAVAERVAVANCLESSVGATRHSCLQQARIDLDGSVAVTASLETAGTESGGAHSMAAGSAIPAGMSMVIPVNFMAR